MNEPNRENPAPDNHVIENKLLDAMIESMRAETPGADTIEGARTRLREKLAQAQAALAAPVRRRSRVVDLLLGSPKRALGSAFGLAAAAAMLIFVSQLFSPSGAQAQAMSGAGDLFILGADGQPAAACPLQHTDVQATVTGLVGRVTVTQTFYNPSPDKIEAVYVFPLPENAAVDAMAINLNGRRIVGKMLPKPQARAVYNAAKAAGQVAGLLDQQRPNIFQQSVANIEPGATIEVEISYVQTLKYEDGSLEFVYPMTVAPRFNPAGIADPTTADAPSSESSSTQIDATASGGSGFFIQILGGQNLNDAQRLKKIIEDYNYNPIFIDRQGATYRVLYGPLATREAADQAFAKLKAGGITPQSIIQINRINPPLPGQALAGAAPTTVPPDQRTGGDISLSVNIEAGLAIQKVESKVHDVEIKRPSATEAVVTLKNRREIPNRDFILRVTTATDKIGDAMLAQTDARGTFFTLILEPPQWTAPTDIVAKEMLFVIDRSGSMGGWKIEKAKAAMHQCIEKLAPGDTFNVLSFANGVTRLFPSSAQATPENIAQGLSFVDAIQANGGTQMLPALKEVLAKPGLDRAAQFVAQVNGGAPQAGKTVRGIFRKFFMLPSLNGVLDEGPYLYSPDFRSWIRLYDPKGLANGIADGTEISVRLGAPVEGMSPDRPTIDAINPDGPDEPERVRFVGFMTDGEVGNDFQILDEVKKNAGTTRVFTFGVGGSVNRFLLQGMADLGRGAAEFVDQAADSASAASKFFVHVNAPILSDVAIDWGGLPVEELYPSPLPDLYSAKPVMVHGRIAPQKGFDPKMLAGKTLTLRGRTAVGPFERQVKIIETKSPQEGSALASLWARSKIEALMHEDLQGLQSGNFREEIKQQITDLGVQFGLMTQFTSFVAVDELVTTSAAPAKTVQVAGKTPKDEEGNKTAADAMSLLPPSITGSPLWNGLTDVQKQKVISESRLRKALNTDNSAIQAQKVNKADATRFNDADVKQLIAEAQASNPPAPPAAPAAADNRSWLGRTWDSVTGSDKAKVARAKADLRSISTGIESYVIDYNTTAPQAGPGQMDAASQVLAGSNATVAAGSAQAGGNLGLAATNGASSYQYYRNDFDAGSAGSAPAQQSQQSADSGSRTGNGMARQGGGNVSPLSLAPSSSLATSLGTATGQNGGGSASATAAPSAQPQLPASKDALVQYDAESDSIVVVADDATAASIQRAAGVYDPSNGTASNGDIYRVKDGSETPAPAINFIKSPIVVDDTPVSSPDWYVYPDALNMDALGKDAASTPAQGAATSTLWSYTGPSGAQGRYIINGSSALATPDSVPQRPIGDASDTVAKKVVVIKLQNGADPTKVAAEVQKMFGPRAGDRASTATMAVDDKLTSLAVTWTPDMDRATSATAKLAPPLDRIAQFCYKPGALQMNTDIVYNRDGKTTVYRVRSGATFVSIAYHGDVATLFGAISPYLKSVVSVAGAGPDSIPCIIAISPENLERIASNPQVDRIALIDMSALPKSSPNDAGPASMK